MTPKNEKVSGWTIAMFHSAWYFGYAYGEYCTRNNEYDYAVRNLLKRGYTKSQVCSIFKEEIVKEMPYFDLEKDDWKPVKVTISSNISE